MKVPLYLTIILIANLFQLNLNAQKKPLEDNNIIKSIPSLKEACKKFDKKLLLNVDLAYFFKDCSIHLITDPQLINILIKDHNIEPINMSTKAFAALPIGKNYSEEDYQQDFYPNHSKLAESICDTFNDKIISKNNDVFYYVESCKKRKFNSYEDVEKFNTTSNSIYSVSQFELSRLKDGKPMTVKSKTRDIKGITELELKKNLPKKEILCKNLNHKVAAFHESFFYVEKCVLFPIIDFSVELQMKAQLHEGIQELTLEQILGLEEGKKISSAEVLKMMK